MNDNTENEINYINFKKLHFIHWFDWNNETMKAYYTYILLTCMIKLMAFLEINLFWLI